jgi:hypothetical protein
MVPPHVLLATNGPDAAMEWIETATVPVLVSITTSGGLVVLTNCAAGKPSGVLGEKLSAPVFAT